MGFVPTARTTYFDKNVTPGTRQWLSAKTPSMPQIRQLSVKRLKFHLSRKPFSRHAPRVWSQFRLLFAKPHWRLPLIDPRMFRPSIRPIIPRRGFVAGLCGETSSATSETFSAPNFRCRGWYTRGCISDRCIGEMLSNERPCRIDVPCSWIYVSVR